MERTRRALLVLVALVTGAAVAVVALAPPQPEADAAVLPPASRAPDPPSLAAGESTTLYDARIAASSAAERAEGHHVFRMRTGDRDLVVTLEVQGASEPTFSLALQDPRGDEVERCGSRACAWTIPRPQAGLWRIVVPGQLDQPVQALVRVARASSIQSEETVYDEERSVPPTTPTRAWEDAFIVLPGQTTLEFEAGARGATPACAAATSVTLVSPHGGAVASFQGSYTQRDADPGRWLLQWSVGPCQAAFGRVRALAS